MEVDASKWDRLVAAWHRRDAGDEVNLLSWSASLRPAVAETLIKQGLIKPPRSFADAANDYDELLIAARMAGALPTNQIVEILSLARRFDHHPAERLDTLSVAAIDHLHGLSPMKPFGEGEELARFVRHWLKIGPSEPLNIFDIAISLGMEF